MPRRKINVAKLYELKEKINALDIAREQDMAYRRMWFDIHHRDRFERAVDRAWMNLRAA